MPSPRVEVSGGASTLESTQWMQKCAEQRGGSCSGTVYAVSPGCAPSEGRSRMRRARTLSSPCSEDSRVASSFSAAVGSVPCFAAWPCMTASAWRSTACGDAAEAGAAAASAHTGMNKSRLNKGAPEERRRKTAVPLAERDPHDGEPAVERVQAEPRQLAILLHPEQVPRPVPGGLHRLGYGR